MAYYDERRDFEAPLYSVESLGFTYDVYEEDESPNAGEYESEEEFKRDMKLFEEGKFSFYRVEKCFFDKEARQYKVIEVYEGVRGTGEAHAIQEVLDMYE